MNLSKLRLITFDVTGTLLKFRNAPGMQYGEIGAMYGVLADNNTLSANFKAHWYKMNQEHPNFGLKSGLGWEQWWKNVVAGTFKDSRLNLSDKKLDTISSHLIEVYKTSACWQQSFGASDLLTFLRNKNIPLGIVSNFDPRLPVTLENTRLRHFFEFVIISYDVGVEKPSPEIFEEAIKQSQIGNLKPEECLHIGDKPLLDYCGAIDSKWHALLVNERPPAEITAKYPKIDTNHIFSSLYDLHKFLSKMN